MTDPGFDSRKEVAKDSGAELRPGVAEALNQAEKEHPGALKFAIDSILPHPDRQKGLLEKDGFVDGGDAAQAWTAYKKLLTPKQLDGIREQVGILVAEVDMTEYLYKAGDVIHAIHNDLKEDDAAEISLARFDLRSLASRLGLESLFHELGHKPKALNAEGPKDGGGDNLGLLKFNKQEDQRVQGEIEVEKEKLDNEGGLPK